MGGGDHAAMLNISFSIEGLKEEAKKRGRGQEGGMEGRGKQ